MLWLTIHQVHNGHSLVDSRKYTPFLSLSEWTNYLRRGMQYSCRWKLRLRLFPALPQKAAVIAGNTLPKVDETMTHSLLFFYSVFFFFFVQYLQKAKVLHAYCTVLCWPGFISTQCWKHDDIYHNSTWAMCARPIYCEKKTKYSEWNGFSKLWRVVHFKLSLSLFHRE